MANYEWNAVCDVIGRLAVTINSQLTMVFTVIRQRSIEGKSKVVSMGWQGAFRGTATISGLRQAAGDGRNCREMIERRV